MKNLILPISLIAFIFLLSSCSVTKMRYSRGWNISFLERGKDVAKATKIKNKERKQINQDIVTAEQPSAPVAVVEQPAMTLATTPVTFASSIKESSVTSKHVSVLKKTVTRLLTKANHEPSPKYSPLGHKSSHNTAGDGTNAWGIAGFICGLLGWIFPLLFIPGLVLSAIGLGRNKSMRGLAIAGLILSIIGLFLVFVVTALAFVP